MATRAEKPTGVIEEFKLRDGRIVQIRPSRAADAASVAEAMRTATSATLRNRFLVAFHGLPESELRQSLEITSPNECCLVAVLGDRVVGGVRFVRREGEDWAEFAVTVHDQFQMQGLGTALMKCLIKVARQRGIRRFVGDALNDNRAIIALVNGLGPTCLSRCEPGVRHLEFTFDELVE